MIKNKKPSRKPIEQSEKFQTLHPTESSYSNSKKSRGLQSELVAVQYFEMRGFRLIGHRFKTPFAEIDLLFSQDNRLLMVEVKTVSGDFPKILSHRQRVRLQRAAIWLTAQFNKGVESALVVVSHDNDIEVIDDFLG